ncbi:fructose 1,6-bisphosphatase [Rasiella rasia]|uniref:Fructose 1,6-bisphosphatase n=1 Tax=Rasiella rasia TaxID=2744027 RepID=A0A6G6GMI0_9FLAO|nr:fructose 1,6-bisphosphatase [Rasiella rasia]QIE59762.1 fructose 1,6-bisphosphatase [Rasiella rasia]
MAKKNTPSEGDLPMDSSSKIEAIKNLIFGENILEIDSEFNTLKKEIDHQKETLQNYIDEVRNELMQSIDSLSTDVNIRITDLEDAMNSKTDALSESKVDRKQLSALLIKLGENIGS